MALTLLEYAKSVEDPKRRGIIEVYAKTHDLFRVLPFNVISGNAEKFDREGSLPSVEFRGYNEAYTESSGTVDPRIESLSIAGGDVDVDARLVKQGGAGRRGSEIARKVKALSHRAAHTFIKGDTSSAIKEFDGFQVRCTGSQLLAAGSTSGGDALSLGKLDELIDMVDDATHLVMSKAMRRLITAAARNTGVGGFVTQTRDEFGRMVEAYRDLPIVIADPNGAVYSSLGFNESNPGGGSAVGTSIYCAAFRDGMLTGIHNSPPEVDDFGHIAEKPVYRARIEWAVGLAQYHPRAIARLYGIKNAAVTA